jgi:hypothetical protein
MMYYYDNNSSAPAHMELYPVPGTRRYVPVPRYIPTDDHHDLQSVEVEEVGSVGLPLTNQEFCGCCRATLLRY